KQEMYYGNKFNTFDELNSAIREYIDYYNNKRIKIKLAGMSPVQFRIQSSQSAA
ncbi:MAG: integrase core domain-containing protein, partial [Fusobacteria bacterium]|nr:integrase core domain-containing protein [Fusobacteriota bacterium]